MSNMFLNVVSTFKGDGLQAATRQLGAFGQSAGGLGSVLGKVGAALATFGVVAKSIEFTRTSIDSARDLERNLFSVNTIFGELAPRMVKFSKDAENIGLSQKDAAKAVTFLGSVLKQSGFAMEDVVTESEKLVSLGVDLAATYGYDVQEALLGMTALFRGEYDPIEKFGVAMKQSEINSELAARGLDKLEGAARRNAEQTIRMELLYERAADATGAFTAQSGNLFVEQKKLSAQFENMQATVGAALLPAMGELVQTLKPLVDELTPRLIQVVTDAQPALRDLTQFLKDAGDEATTTGQTVGFLADALGKLFSFASSNFGLLVQLAGLFLAVRTAVMLVTAALATTTAGWIIIALGALATAMVLVADAASKLEDSQYKANIQLLKNDPVRQALNPYSVYGDILNKVGDSSAEVSSQTKRMLEEVARADKARLNNLRDSVLGVKISAREAANELRRMREQAGLPGVAPEVGTVGTGTQGTTGTGAGASPAAQVVSGLPALIQSAKKNERVLKKEIALGGAGLSKEVAKWVTSSNTPVKAANQALKRIANNGQKAINNLTRNFNRSEAGQQAAAAASAAVNAQIIADQEAANRLAEQLRQAETARLEEQQRVYESFLDAIKGTFAGIKNAITGAFDITGLGGSTNAIMRNMDKLLVRLRSFSANVKQLATMGLDPTLLQQVITMGPMAGARLATALVQGGAGALSAINTGFGQVGSLASEIATTGTQSMFDRDVQRTAYTINVGGGVGSGATIGKAIVDAIKDYERTSGAVFQPA